MDACCATPPSDGPSVTATWELGAPEAEPISVIGAQTMDLWEQFLAGKGGQTLLPVVWGEGACAHRQAMSSSTSVQEGIGPPDSPMPPAVSPLTEPIAAEKGEGWVSMDLDDQPLSDQQQRQDAPFATHSATNDGLVANGTDVKTEPDDLNHTNQIALHSPVDAHAWRRQQQQIQAQLDMVMALAQLSAANRPRAPHPTVTPAQVSLPNGFHNPGHHDFHGILCHGLSGQETEISLESFARIEFADSVFQMTTYEVIIGRDIAAMRQAKKNERRAEEHRRRVDECTANGLPLPSPPTYDRGKFSKSYVSEEGGMLGPESDDEGPARPTKRRKTSDDLSGFGTPTRRARCPRHESPFHKDMVFDRQYISHTPGAAAVNLSALRPTPHRTIFLPIHSPGPDIAAKTKAISRNHMRIRFNQTKGVFEAIPMHKNGFFCQDIHYSDESVVLRSGDRLQIKDVPFLFVINSVSKGYTGVEEEEEDGEGADSICVRRYSEGGKEMSFEFESTHHTHVHSSSDVEAEKAQGAVETAQPDGDDELSDPSEDIANFKTEDRKKSGKQAAGRGNGTNADQVVLQSVEDGEQVVKPEQLAVLSGGLQLSHVIPKKRGPGRPPKNGYMSKREERLLKKAALEEAKKNMPQPVPGEAPAKRKVGRPRKNTVAEGEESAEKRKYKARKKSGEDGDGGEGGDGSDAEKPARERRREKPKTPPLELKREEFTEEQLQKPTKNYGVLIDEVLRAEPDGLTLKQIYKRIQQKYPFYYFNQQTKGWESSVRHNLIGNQAFVKNDETHLWRRDLNVDLDAGKKRKAVSPDRNPAPHGYGQDYAHPMSRLPYQGANMQAHAFQAGTAQHAKAFLGSHLMTNMARGQHGYPAQSATPGQQTDPLQLLLRQGEQAGGAPAYGPQTGGQQVPASTQAPTQASRPPGHGVAASAPQHGPSSRAPVPHHSGPPHSNSSVAHTGSSTAAPAPPQPAVAPELVRLVEKFKPQVMSQLDERTNGLGEAIATAAVSRGLGLTARCMVPDHENYENIVLGVFEQSKDGINGRKSLSPTVLQPLIKFKDTMIGTLLPQLGALKAEWLLLSAIHRVLGFADKCVAPGTPTEKAEWLKAEAVLIPVIKQVLDTQLAAAAAAAAGTLRVVAQQGPIRTNSASGPPRQGLAAEPSPATAADAAVPQPWTTLGRAPVRHDTLINGHVPQQSVTTPAHEPAAAQVPSNQDELVDNEAIANEGAKTKIGQAQQIPPTHDSTTDGGGSGTLNPTQAGITPLPQSLCQNR